jgi:hypothetical protein
MAGKGGLPRSFGSSLYPDITYEIRCAGNQKSARSCSEVRELLDATRLGRGLILETPISQRKHGWKPHPVVS